MSPRQNDPMGLHSGHGMSQMPGMGYEPISDAYANPHQGGVFDMMEYLLGKYRQFIRLEYEKREAAGKKLAMSLEKALSMEVPMGSFYNFCRRFLATHRPVQTFPADANVGLRLSNNESLVISPRTQGDYAGYGGAMQHSGDVNITHGESQPGMDGVIRDGGIQII